MIPAQLRSPIARDGTAVNQLIQHCPPLDPNSVYCNLLQCSHFADTSVIAEVDGEVAGFISGYAVPSRPDTLFIWQVAVGDKARGQGVATRMLRHILDRPREQRFRYLETTITEDNKASWALFTGLSQKLDAAIEHVLHFDREAHFDGQHETEMLVHIGPF